MTVNERAAAPVHHTAVVQGAWDGPGNEAKLPSPMTRAKADRFYAVVQPQADGTVRKQDGKLGHHQVDANGNPGAAVMNGVRNALSRLPQTQGLSAAERAGAERHLRAHLEDGGGGQNAATAIDVVRSAPAIELRADADAGDAMPTMAGHFARFDQWYEIDSFFEGRFLERVARGAFSDTFAAHWADGDPHRIKVQFQHGRDPSVGQRLLGQIGVLQEDSDGGYYEVPLFDTSYNRDLIPGLKAREYGASFRFRVTTEEWNEEPGVSDHNPRGLPERTITGAKVFELGPVAFGASPTATAGLRSLTDEYYEALRDEQPSVFADACRAVGWPVPTELDRDGDDGAGGGRQPVRRARNTGSGRRAQRSELKALPDAVLSRDRGVDLEAITIRRRGQELIEARRVTPRFDVDQCDDDRIKVSAYLVAYDEPRQIAAESGWTEIWAPGAAARSVNGNPDVRLTLNGEGEPLARSRAGSLNLVSDDYGLKIRATIDPSTPRGEEIALALQRNERVDAVVGLDVIRQAWDDGHTGRTVEEVRLHDIALILDDWDPRSGEDLSRLHVDATVDDESGGMSLELARAINDTFDI